MITRLHWLILRKWPGPFFGWLGTLMFLLLMQFLIRWLPELAGKGLPLSVIAELVVYNLAYMVVLAVPMSVLLATLMAFGQLAGSQAYTVIKSAGVSFTQLVWPVLIVGLLVTGSMVYFNNIILPEANFRARNLWRDIRTKQPGFELRPGLFYDGLKGYSILVQQRDSETNRISDVTIYEYGDDSREQTVIKAEHGQLVSEHEGRALRMVLYDGEIHRTRPPRLGSSDHRYERLNFDRHTLKLDLSDFVFERSDPSKGNRSDRTMRTTAMIDYVDSLQAELHRRHAEVRGVMYETLIAPLSDSARAPAGVETRDYATVPSVSEPSPADSIPSRYVALRDVSRSDQTAVLYAAQRTARSTRTTLSNLDRNVSWRSRRVKQYQVEIQKKFSIAIACLIFALIGAPLGLTIRRGSLGAVGAYALGIFLFYWVTLVQGEKLADRGLLPPWVGMWIANVIMTGVGMWLVTYVTLDLRATPPLRRRLWQWLTSTSD
jgi:lipopolysaccharide export system permease protein